MNLQIVFQFQGIDRGIPEDRTIFLEVELVSITEKTGRFYRMDTNSDELVTFQEFKKYMSEKVFLQRYWEMSFSVSLFIGHIFSLAQSNDL